MSNPTLKEMKQSIDLLGDHKLVSINLGRIDCTVAHLKEAFTQIEKAVLLCTCGKNPKDYRAEFFLLLCLQESLYHGYTPVK